MHIADRKLGIEKFNMSYFIVHLWKNGDQWRRHLALSKMFNELTAVTNVKMWGKVGSLL